MQQGDDERESRSQRSRVVKHENCERRDVDVKAVASIGKLILLRA